MKTMWRRVIIPWSVMTLFISVLLGVGHSPASASTKLRFCNEAPYSVSSAYMYYEVKNDDWNTEGWWNLEPGECVVMSRTVNNRYHYVHGQASGDLLDWLNEGKTSTKVWGENDTQGCIHPTKKFHLEEKNNCTGLGEKLVKFLKIDVGKKNEHTFTFSDSSLPVDSLEQAAKLSRALQGRMEHETQVLAFKEEKYPFDIGVNLESSLQNKKGVIVSKVYASLPADFIGMKSGDRIVSINGRNVFSEDDVLEIINDYGFTHDAPRSVSIEVWRGNDIMQGEITLEYFYQFDPRRTKREEARALGVGFWDSMFWGFGSSATCYLESVGKTIDVKQCALDLDREWSRLEEMYPKKYQIGDVGGMFISIPRGLLSGAIRSPRLFGSRAIGRIITAMTIEGAEGALTVIGQAKPEENQEDIIRDAWTAGKYNGAIGGIIGLIWK